MAEQSLASGAPIIAEPQLKAFGEERSAAKPKTEPKKTAAADPAAKGGNKQKKLHVHLW